MKNQKQRRPNEISMQCGSTFRVQPYDETGEAHFSASQAKPTRFGLSLPKKNLASRKKKSLLQPTQQ